MVESVSHRAVPILLRRSERISDYLVSETKGGASTYTAIAGDRQ